MEKLLVTASTFPRWEGDTEPRFILDLSEELTKYYDVTVLVPAAPGVKMREDMGDVHVIRYHYFPVHKWETLCYPGAIVPRIREKKIRVLLVPCLLISLYFKLMKVLPAYDIVHAHWLIPQGIIQAFFKKPYIVTGHGGDVASLNRGILKKMKIKCLKQARHVTVVSEDLKGKVQQLVPGLEPSVISMGVDTSKFGEKYRKENYFGQDNKKVVLFVGRLAEKKGVTYLIEAMKNVDAVLVIAGDGPLKEALIEQAKEQGDKIKFIGSKTHDELQVIYASADVFAAPFITAKDGDKEGLSVVVLEAMASGLPIVVNKVGGIGELLEDGETALLCEEKNTVQLTQKITAALNDMELRYRLCDNASRLVQQYDYKEIAQKYAAVMGKQDC